MKSTLVEKPALTLVGFNFFGDPFRSHGGWSEENEIGRLWVRWMAYLESNAGDLPPLADPNVMYEVHVYHAETLQTGEFEVFAGVEIAGIADLPPQVVVKVLPAGRYAVLTLAGEEIVADWTWQLDHEWLPALGVQRQTTFSVLQYDARFKGMGGEALAGSEMDTLIPLLA